MTLYCTECGKSLDVITQIFDLPAHNSKPERHIEIVLGTCENDKCALHSHTLSEKSMLKACELSRYKVTAKFDIYTGERK